MGDFTSIRIMVSFNDADKADEFASIIDDLDNQLVKRGVEQPFTTGIEDVNGDDLDVEVTLSSPRTANAEWQAEEISKIAKEFKEFVTQFDATKTLPQTFIYWDSENEI